VGFSLQLHVHSSSIGISSRADKIQYCQLISKTGKIVIYICKSFDGELLEYALKPAYKHHGRFAGVLIPTGEV
jgi:hypothetical protein